MPTFPYFKRSAGSPMSIFATFVRSILFLMLAGVLLCPAGRAFGEEKMAQSEALRIMGLSENASQEEIKDRYRQMTKQTHPDAGGSAEQFIQLQRAFDALNTTPKPSQTPSGEGVFDGVWVQPHRFSLLANLPREYHRDFEKLMILWDNTAGLEYDKVLNAIAKNTNAKVSMKAFYEAHLKLMQFQLVDPVLAKAIEPLVDAEVMKYANNSRSATDALLSAYLKELIEAKDLTRFRRIVRGYNVPARLDERHLNGTSEYPKTGALLSQPPADPLFAEFFAEIMQTRPLSLKEGMEFARKGLVSWERMLDQFSNRIFIDKKEQPFVEEILRNLPASAAKKFAISQLAMGSNSVVEMPILRQYAEKIPADQLPWKSFVYGAFFKRSKEIILEILLRAERAQPGYIEGKIQDYIQLFERGRRQYGDRYMDRQIDEIKKLHKKLKNELKKKETESARGALCGKVFGS